MFSALFGGNEGQDDGSSEAATGGGGLFGGLLEIVQDQVAKVTDVAMADLQDEQRKFVNNKHGTGRDAAVPPWIGYDNEDELKTKILALSTDKRNFIRDPPAGQKMFSFSFEEKFPVALAILQEDDKLEKMRFELVPKTCTEDRFWGNYFYRVALIMQSSEASATTATQETTPDTTNATDTDNTVPPTPTSSTDADADNDPVVEDKDLPDPLASLPEAAALPVVDLAELGGAAQPTPQAPEAESNAAPHASTVAEAAESEDSEGDVDEGDPDGDDEDWEKELAAELDNFELAEEAEGEKATGSSWEDVADELLEEG